MSMSSPFETRVPVTSARALALAAVATFALSPLPVAAQAPMASSEGASAVISAASVGQRITLPLGKSAIIDLPVEARDVVVANPEVADAVMRTSRRGFLLGVKTGETNVFFLDASGRQILALEIRVARDTSEFDALVRRLVPDARVEAEGIGDSLLLSGEVPTPAAADSVLRIARQYAGDPEKVVNMMTVKTSDQVMLRVRIVEMQRSVIKQLGINLSATNLLRDLLPKDWGLNFATANGFSANGSFLGGSTLSGAVARFAGVPASTTFPGPIVDYVDPRTLGVGGYSQTIDSTTGIITTVYGPAAEKRVATQSTDGNIQALERVGLARTLAEPNLTAISGEAAKFLAGGEFPVPVAQEGSRISVEFKPFGVGLGFTPIVLGPDRISLKISTEVSEISTAASFRQPDTVLRDSSGRVTDTIRGLSIPGVQVRRAETTMEMASGRSMIMAGLIQQQTRQAVEGLPGVKDLPVLGNLFRSRDFQNNETELVVIVTPFLVNSTTMDQLQTPADGYAPASDSAGLLLGRMNRIVRPNRAGAPPPGRYRAPVGHVTP